MIVPVIYLEPDGFRKKEAHKSQRKSPVKLNISLNRRDFSGYNMAWKLLELHLGLVMVLFVLTCVHAITEPKDVTALNSLYISLEEPAQLTLWNSSGGDPCGGGWLGVICTGSNVTELYVHFL